MLYGGHILMFMFVCFSARRAHLKECFDSLKKQVPSLEEKKTSNLNILRGALKYIQVSDRPRKAEVLKLAWFSYFTDIIWIWKEHVEAGSFIFRHTIWCACPCRSPCSGLPNKGCCFRGVRSKRPRGFPGVTLQNCTIRLVPPTSTSTGFHIDKGVNNGFACSLP